MKRFVVYEIWTRTHTTEARDVERALEQHDVRPIAGLNLVNWHADSPGDGIDGTPIVLVYENFTRHRIVLAESLEAALCENDPNTEAVAGDLAAVYDLNLSGWHAVEVGEVAVGYALRGPNGGYLDTNAYGDWTLLGNKSDAVLFQSEEAARLLHKELRLDDDVDIVPMVRTVREVLSVGDAL